MNLIMYTICFLVQDIVYSLTFIIAYISYIYIQSLWSTVSYIITSSFILRL